MAKRGTRPAVKATQLVNRNNPQGMPSGLAPKGPSGMGGKKGKKGSIQVSGPKTRGFSAPS